MKAVLEGLLFISGDDGITLEQIKEILSVEEKEALELLDSLKEELKTAERGLSIKKYGNIYKFTTKEEHKKYYEKLSELSNFRNLSQSTLETLAIIAYNEPITRQQIDELRGVSSSQMVRNLVAKDFIKEVGRSESVGHPILYGITNQFLDYFGLSSIKDLPNLEEIETKEEEIDLYTSKYQEKKEIEEEIEQL